MPTASATSSCRRSSAASTTTRERRGSSSGPALGAQSTLSGGGRYDYLVEEIGGPPTPGVGFGAGIERLLLALEEAGVEVEARRDRRLLRRTSEGADRPALLAQMAELRRAGWRCDAEYAGRSKKGQLTQAKRLRARFLVEADADGATIASLDGRRRGAGGAGRGGGPAPARAGSGMTAWRDLGCGEVRPEHIGKQHTLAGWAATRRDHGKLVFVDLRDSTGLCQLVVNPERAPEAIAAAHSIRNEFVLQAEGEVGCPRARGRQPEPADRRGGAPGRPARDPLALPAAAVPARRGRRGRDPPLSLSLARPAPRQAPAEPPDAGARPSESSAGTWRRPASSTSRRRSWASRRRRGRATSSFRAGSSGAASSPSHSHPRSTSSCSLSPASSATTRSRGASGTKTFAPTGSRS